MLAESNIPRVGALLRHRPSGLPARLERIAGPHVKIFKVFADGTTKLVHLSEFDDDLTEQEMERFSHDLPIVTETSLRQIIRRRKRLGNRLGVGRITFVQSVSPKPAEMEIQ